MGRYDKYGPKTGGFRAALAADFNPANLEKVIGVGLDSSGHVVAGAGQTGIIGVLVLTSARKAGEVVDVMTSGEIVEFGPSDSGKVPGTDFGVAGTAYFSDANGVITATNTGVRVGHTVEGKRLVVRVEPGVAGAVDFSSAPAHSIPISALNATGTPSASNYLKGDGTWGTVGS